MVTVTMAAVKMMMKARGRGKKPEEYGGVRRRIRNRLVDVRGAVVHRYPLWTFGEPAHITVDRDDVARSCATLLFFALPVHARTSSLNLSFA